MKTRLFVLSVVVFAVPLFIGWSVTVRFGRPFLTDERTDTTHGCVEYAAYIQKSSWPNPFGVTRTYIVIRYDYSTGFGALREDIIRFSSWQKKRLIGELACVDEAAQESFSAVLGCRQWQDSPGLDPLPELLPLRDRMRQEFNAVKLIRAGILEVPAH